MVDKKNDKLLLEKYKNEIMTLQFCIKCCNSQFDMDCKENGDFLKYIQEQNKLVFNVNKDNGDKIPIFQEMDDIIKPIETFLSKMYVDEIVNQFSKLKEIIDFELSDVHYGMTKRKLDIYNSKVSEIIVKGQKSSYSSVIAMHEIIHCLLPFSYNMYHNEIMSIMHEWLYMDENYFIFRSANLFSQLTILDKDYSDIGNKKLISAIKQSNKFVVDMYTISYIYSLIFKKYYLEDQKLYISKFLEYRNDPLYIEKLLKYYNIRFDSSETHRVVEDNYKKLKKKNID